MRRYLHLKICLSPILKAESFGKFFMISQNLSVKRDNKSTLKYHRKTNSINNISLEIHGWYT
jgi:hypothetical protein